MPHLRAADRSFPLSVLLLALAIAGCGDSTGPDESLDLTGDWSYSAANLDGQFRDGTAISCDVTGVNLDLTQTGSSFSGATTVGSLICRAGGAQESGTISFAGLEDGQVSGTEVSFKLIGGTDDWTHSGSADANSMSGTVQVSVPLDDQVVDLAGQWQATRQSATSRAAARRAPDPIGEAPIGDPADLLVQLAP